MWQSPISSSSSLSSSISGMSVGRHHAVIEKKTERNKEITVTYDKDVHTVDEKTITYRKHYHSFSFFLSMSFIMFVF